MEQIGPLVITDEIKQVAEMRALFEDDAARYVAWTMESLNPMDRARMKQVDIELMKVSFMQGAYMVFKNWKRAKG